MEKLVIIGNGMAPGRMLEELFEKAPGLYDVTIFNAEPRVNYDRIMLSPVLSGEKSFEDIIIHDEAWYASHGITLHKGEKITGIDRQAKTVTSASGITASYDKLIIATGSKPFIAPVPGNDLAGVVSYRDLDDVEKMLEIASRQGKAVVIGGGVLGLEAAYGLKRQGMDVTVLHIGSDIMDRQLDKAASNMLRRALEDRGIEIITKANTKAILGDTGVVGVELEDGRILEAELVVMAVGIRPSTQLAQLAGLAINRGIVVDDGMQTSDASIYALGECAEHRGVCYGLVAPLYESATVLADRLAGGKSTYKGSVTNTKLKVTGINLFSAGDFASGEDREEILLRDASNGIYKRLIVKDNTLIGAVLYGDATDGSWFFDLIKNKTDISLLRDTLIFGQSYESSDISPYGGRCSLTGDGEIAGYNNTYKQKTRKTVVETIETASIFEFDAVLQPSKVESAPKLAPLSAFSGSKHSLSGDQTTEVLNNLSLRIEKSDLFSSVNFLNSDHTYLYRTAALMSVTSVTSNPTRLKMKQSRNSRTKRDHLNSSLHFRDQFTSKPDYAFDETVSNNRSNSHSFVTEPGFLHSQNGDQTTEVLNDLSLRIEKGDLVSNLNHFLNSKYVLLNPTNASASVTLGTGSANPVGNQIERLAEHYEAAYYPELHRNRKNARTLEALRLGRLSGGGVYDRGESTQTAAEARDTLLSRTAVVLMHSQTGDQTTEVLKDLSLHIEKRGLAAVGATSLTGETHHLPSPLHAEATVGWDLEEASPTGTPVAQFMERYEATYYPDIHRAKRKSRIVAQLKKGTLSGGDEHDVRQNKKRTIHIPDNAPSSEFSSFSMHSLNGDQTTEVLKDLSLRIENGVFASNSNQALNSNHGCYSPAYASPSVTSETGRAKIENLITSNGKLALERAV